jgi:hypothetical protein
LDDTTVRAFRLLVQWLYFKKLEIAQLKNDWVKNIVMQATENNSLAELWVLADKLGIPQLQNVAIETMHQIYSKVLQIPVYTSKYIYNNTSPTSALRRYIVELCAVSLRATSFSESQAQFPHEMLIDITTFYSSYWHDNKSKKCFINPVDYRVPDDIDGTS